jgi:alkylhydroperoxidase family enzyme
MAYISQISESEASGLLQQAYELARDRSGGLANIIRIMSHDAETLNASMQFYVKLMKSPNALSSQQKEMLATVVSGTNDCYY